MPALNRAVLCLAVITAVTFTCIAALPAAALRPFTVRDMYHLEQVGETSVFSPSGKEVAFIVKRPVETERNFAQDFLQNDDVADIWIGNLETGHIENITNGVRDRWGYWKPTWSPDGTRLALLSTRGDNIYLWTWDRANGLRKITTRAIEISTPITWLSNDRILCQVLPAGEQPESMSVERQTPRIATHEWPIDWAGQHSTANILQSGITPNLALRPQRDLQIVDLSGGSIHVKTLGHAVHFQDLTLSPNRRYAAIYHEVGILEPRAGRKFQSSFDDAIYALDIYDLSSGSRTAHFGPRLVGSTPFSWSLDGNEIAVFGEPATTANKSPSNIFRCVVATQSCTTVLPASLTVDSGPNGAKTAPLWASGGRLVVYANSGGTDGKKDRWDWYSFDRNGSSANFTSTLSKPPTSLTTVDGGDHFVAIVAGKLTALFPNGQSARTLAIGGLPSKLTAILWPKEAKDAGQNLLVSAGDSVQDFFTVNLSSRSSTHLARVGQNVAFNAFEPKTRSLIFAESSRNGSFIRYTYNGGPIRPLYTTNTWLAGIAEGRAVHYTYKSLDGKKLDAWIILPINYRAGHKYPAVVWVYGGSVMNAKKPYSLGELNDVHALNLQFLPAHGYAVIFPSMPLPEFGHPTDPYPLLPNGVLPAVDEAVQLGYVDTNRVGVMGQSYGGFSTYSLITETNRFKAAVALAGVSDWNSLYGVYDGRMRYIDDVNDNDQFMSVLIEDGQGNLGDPPWVNPQRYARNSPITYVDKVHTPLLIIQGDLDYVSVIQGEQFFTALYRQGKRAEFARYWGEEHVFRSEANIIDYWNRMIAWFDEFLR